MRRHAAERAVERADRGAGRAGDDDVGHDFSSTDGIRSRSFKGEMAWCRPVENDGATQHAATIAVFSQTRQGPAPLPQFWRSEEHTSELQSLMRISYDVFCLKKTKQSHHYNLCVTSSITPI